MQTYDRVAACMDHHNPVTLTLDLLTPGSMHAEGLAWTIIPINFGVESASRFSLRSLRDTQTHTQASSMTQNRPDAEPA